MPQKLHPITNKQVADILFEIADILELQDVQFKPIAYRKVARSIASLSNDIKIYYNKDILKEIPGVGEGIEEKLKELIETGKLRYYEKLKKRVPEGLVMLLNVPNIGSKTAKLLYKRFRVQNLADLKKVLKKHKLSKIRGFKEKTEKELLEGIDIVKKSKERMLLADVLRIAERIERELKNLKEVKQISLAGSILRRLETVHDVDILVTTSKPGKIINYFTSMKDIQKIISKGTTKASIRIRPGIQVDLRVVKPEQFGSALQYFTGSKEHSVRLRQIAIEKGYKLSEYGLFKRKTNKLVEAKSEKKIYNKLGMDWMGPELRENRGEIEAAIKHKLPKLVKQKDIMADLHMHTNYSDGNHTIEQMALACKKLGYRYIAITDHSKSRVIAHGLKFPAIKKQWGEIDKVNKKVHGIKILKGIEVDIMANGKLDYPNSIMKQFDFVIASIHSGFKKDNTKRILTAMDNEYVNVIAHPTGRLILYSKRFGNPRKPYPLNFEKVFDKCKETNIFLEINSTPSRLDIKDTNIHQAVKQKLRLVINTDSHSTDHLGFMKYGVYQARRGWAEKKNILNCLDFKKFLKTIKK